MFSIRSLVVKLAMVILCGFVPAAGASVVDAQQLIQGCKNKKTGDLRISVKCKRSETRVRWNVTGLQGSPGEKGSPGDRGVPGEDGRAGSVFLSGERPPSVELGKSGDMYLNRSTMELYGPKVDNSWGVPIGLRGTRGEVGPSGPSGSSGPTGPQGPRGEAGTLRVFSDSSTYVGDFRGYFNRTYYIKVGTTVWQVSDRNPVTADFQLPGKIALRYVVYDTDTCSGPAYVPYSPTVNYSPVIEGAPVLLSAFLNNLDYDVDPSLQRRDNGYVITDTVAIDYFTQSNFLYFRNKDSGSPNNCEVYASGNQTISLLPVSQVSAVDVDIAIQRINDIPTTPTRVLVIRD